MSEEDKEYTQDKAEQEYAENSREKRKIPIHDDNDDACAERAQESPEEEDPPSAERQNAEQEKTDEETAEKQETREDQENEQTEEDGEKDTVTITFAEYEELKTLAEERDEYLQKLQRSVADYQNLHKRLKKERKRSYENGVRETLEHILPLADTLDRALQAAEQSEKPEDVLEGLKLIEKEFYDSLERFDVEPVKSVNEPFDPDYHHAVLQQPSDEVPPQTVLDEIKKGFVRGDTVIRPAQVSVSVEPDQEDDE